MSQTISFEGYSDDIAAVTTDGTSREYDAYDGAQFHLISREGQMQVSVTADPNSGCWHVVIGQTDEVHPLPTWPLYAKQSCVCQYSASLTVEAPDDTELVVHTA